MTNKDTDCIQIQRFAERKPECTIMSSKSNICLKFSVRLQRVSWGFSKSFVQVYQHVSCTHIAGKKSS